MSPQEESLVRAAMDSPPEDKGPLLILADWYDDHKEPTLAYACRWMAHKCKRFARSETHLGPQYGMGFWHRGEPLPQHSQLPHSLREEWLWQNPDRCQERTWRGTLLHLGSVLLLRLEDLTWTTEQKAEP